MFDQYEIAVRLKLLDNLGGPLAMIARHFARTEEAAAKLQKRLNTIRGLFSGGVMAMGVGAGIAAPLIYATDKAAELQKQLIAVQLATHATTAEMTAMRRSIENVTAGTMFSAIDVAKMTKQIATGTGLSAPQVSAVVPAYVRYADVQMLLKDAPYQQSIGDAIRAAHGAGYYDAASLTKYLNLLNKASFFIPGSTSEIARGLAYFQNISKNALGMDDENSVLAVALANRLGFTGTRGGTNLTAALTRSLPGIFGSGLLTGKSGQALGAMSLVDAKGHSRVFTDGHFDMAKWMGLTADYVAHEFASHPAALARQDILTNFQRAYGTNGSRLATALGSKNAIAQWRQMATQFDQLGGFDAMQAYFANNSTAQQYQTAKTNFQTAMTELGITLLPTATKYLKKFNSEMQRLIDWMSSHPDAVKNYAKVFLYLSAAFLGLGTLSVATSGVMGLVTAFRILKSVVVASGVAELALNPLAASIAALGYAAYETYKHWDDLVDSVRHMLGLPPIYRAGGATGPWSGVSGTWLPAPAAASTTVHTTINIDGRKVAHAVTKHQARAMGGPHTGVSKFDDTALPMPAGVTGRW